MKFDLLAFGVYNRKKLVSLISLLFLLLLNGFSQDTAKVKTDTAISRKGIDMPKPYGEVITPAATSKTGLWDVHYADKKWYFEISDSLLGRDILIVSRISKAAAGSKDLKSMLGFGGDQINECVVRFEKGPDHRVFLKVISHFYMSRDSSADGMYRSVLNSNLQSIGAAFPIRAYSDNKLSFVIEVTDFLNDDNSILYFAKSAKAFLALGGFQTDKSYISAIDVHPLNVEINAVKSYSSESDPTSGVATFQLNSSIILLPKKTMKPRYNDPRVGYFGVRYYDFDLSPYRGQPRSMVTRWRLEPKDEDKVKYLKGELVEPKKPIIYYIDPATPAKWVPYLIQGVNDWQQAFEQAGFKNAIMARTAPSKEEDSTWKLESALSNAIVYKAAPIANASGPHVHDPRSGEILETHINWYHNVMELARNWYFVQCAAVDTNARKINYDTELMGQLIRFIIAHEVGHTLGLTHNFGASSTVPTEKLRDNAWLEKYGHTPSIMDYARFNYVAQPEDSIRQHNLFPRIGEYDRWAIEWGYRWFPEWENEDKEVTFLNRWILDSLRTNNRLWFGSEIDVNDPRKQSEDLGQDLIMSSEYGIKNLKRILPNLIEWTKAPNKDFEMLEEMYVEVLNQFNQYLRHVATYISANEYTPRMSEENIAPIEFVSRKKQKEAMAFFKREVFNTPTWLVDTAIFFRISKGGMFNVMDVQTKLLHRLFNSRVLQRLIMMEGTHKATYTIDEFMKDMRGTIFSELATNKPVDVYRRNLQKKYIEMMIDILQKDPIQSSVLNEVLYGGFNKYLDVFSYLKSELRLINLQIGHALPLVKDKSTRYHFEDIRDRIAQVFKK